MNCEETCATFKEWVRDKQHALQLARCTRCKGYSQPYVRCHYFHLFRYRTKYKDWKCRNQGLSPEGPCPSAGHSRDPLRYCNSGEHKFLGPFCNLERCCKVRLPAGASSCPKEQIVDAILEPCKGGWNTGNCPSKYPHSGKDAAKCWNKAMDKYECRFVACCAHPSTDPTKFAHPPEGVT